MPIPEATPHQENALKDGVPSLPSYMSSPDSFTLELDVTPVPVVSTIAEA